MPERLVIDTELDLSGVPDPRLPLWMKPRGVARAGHVSQWWTVGDGDMGALGSTYRLCQLDSGHLLNIYAGLQRLAPQFKRQLLDESWNALMSMQGEQAILDVESALTHEEEQDPEYFVRPIIELIERTLKCRRYLIQRERRAAKQLKRRRFDGPIDEPDDDERSHQFGHDS